MLLHRRWTGVDAGLDRHNAIFPEPLRLLHFAAFFLAGSALYRTPGLLDQLRAPRGLAPRRHGPGVRVPGVDAAARLGPDAPWSFSVLAAGAGRWGRG